jgi:hypothetical protein
MARPFFNIRQHKHLAVQNADGLTSMLAEIKEFFSLFSDFFPF